MKNIVIGGVPRSGKTTFSEMILKEFQNYHLIDSDIIFDAYVAALNEIAIEINGRCTINVNSRLGYELPKKIFDYYAETFPYKGYVLVTNDLSIEEAVKYNKDGNIVLIFGYPNIETNKKVMEIIENDTIEDWTFSQSESNIKMIAENYIVESKENMNQCKKNNIKFVDTSFNRKDVLNDLMNYLKSNL